MELQQGQVTANRLNFAYLEAGSGPLALCLHGFPDSPWTYRSLLPALAEAGYRAVAPFMRGYAPTAIAADGHYRTSDLVGDAVALHQALGGDGEAVLIAHDWGATAAWGATTLEPQRWRRVVIANVPPFQIFGQIAFRYDQLKRSFYFWFFQMSIAESIVGANDLAFLDGLWADWSPGYNATDDLAQVKECLRDPANLRAAMGYYRAFFDPARFGSPEWTIEQGAAWGRPTPQPTPYLHGTNDSCIARDANAAVALRAFLGPDSQVDRIEGVGHFLLVERSQEVNDRILRFLRS